jgi:hypothetical protein
MEHIISLGSSCDGANQLKRRGKNNKTLFFDFLWNQQGGLNTVSTILKNNFELFDDINMYTKTNTNTYLSGFYKITNFFNINKHYPELVFMHHDTTKLEIIDSLQRKIVRTNELFKTCKNPVFIYYRHICYDENIGPIIKEETEQFCATFSSKYNPNFKIISCIMVDQEYDTTKLETIMKTLISHDNIIYEYLYARDDNNRVRNEVANKRWDYIIDLAATL